MAEYAFADIITGKDILADQVKDKDIIGAKGYFASDFKTIVDSFDDKTFPDSLLEGTLETVSYVGRFRRKEDGIYFDYFIRKKEPEKKWVPFDLTKEEDRNRLKGKWIKRKDTGDEDLIISFSDDSVFIAPDQYWGAERLLSLCVFDDGSSCGKEVEE